VNKGWLAAMERLPVFGGRPIVGYAIGSALALVAAAIRWALAAVFPPGFPFVTFFPAVIVTAFVFGRGPGIAAATISGLLAWYLFIPPAGFGADTAVTVALSFYVLTVAVPIVIIDAMQVANRRLAAERTRTRQLAERTELLFRELQHRVSNNLQMVGAVLNLQRREVRDPAAVQALTDASTKLQLIGRIQRKLYDTSGEQVALDVFVAELTDDLIAAGGKPGVRCFVDAEPGLLLSPDAAIPVALILAEGVANAIEHGFADEKGGRIGVAAVRRGGHIELSVRDDGRGLPPGFDVGAANSLGLKIARTLARQLEADFTLRDGAPGTVMELRMPTERTLLRLG